MAWIVKILGFALGNYKGILLAIVVIAIFFGGERVGEWRCAYTHAAVPSKDAADLKACRADVLAAQQSVLKQKEADATSAETALKTAQTQAESRMQTAMIQASTDAARLTRMVESLQSEAKDRESLLQRASADSDGACVLSDDFGRLLHDASDYANGADPGAPKADRRDAPRANLPRAAGQPHQAFIAAAGAGAEEAVHRRGFRVSNPQ